MMHGCGLIFWATMLIDEYLPQYDVVERHTTVVRASAARVYAALRRADLAATPLVRLLLALRALPAVLRDGGSGVQHRRTCMAAPITLRAFEEQSFVVLAETPPHELLIGLVGAFWTLKGGMRPVDAGTFRASQPHGTARAAWNFAIEQRADGCCWLATETRVQYADAASRWRFQYYWWVIRPGWGLIQRCMLWAIRRTVLVSECCRACGSRAARPTHQAYPAQKGVTHASKTRGTRPQWRPTCGFPGVIAPSPIAWHDCFNTTRQHCVGGLGLLNLAIPSWSLVTCAQTCPKALVLQAIAWLGQCLGMVSFSMYKVI